MCLLNFMVCIEFISFFFVGVGCKLVLECKSGEFCYRLISFCLLMFMIVKMKIILKSLYFCILDIECKIIEFCYFFIGMCCY